MRPFSIIRIPQPGEKDLFQVVDQNSIPVPPQHTFLSEAGARARAKALEDEMLLKEAEQKSAVRQPPEQRASGPIIDLSPSWILLHGGRSLVILHPRDAKDHVNLKIGQRIKIEKGIIHVPPPRSREEGGRD